jgi:hypothetical protein
MKYLLLDVLLHGTSQTCPTQADTAAHSAFILRSCHCEYARRRCPVWHLSVSLPINRKTLHCTLRIQIPDLKEPVLLWLFRLGFCSLSAVMPYRKAIYLVFVIMVFAMRPSQSNISPSEKEVNLWDASEEYVCAERSKWTCTLLRTF